MRKTDRIERFWSFTEPEPNTGCLLWTGTGNADGYGLFQDATRTSWLVHRFAWTLANGPIPKGLCVLHRCDVPPCLNVDHLWLGTQADNMADRDRKGRQWNQKKTHCLHGHEYTPENTYRSPARSSRRYCRACIWTREQERAGVA